MAKIHPLASPSSSSSSCYVTSKREAFTVWMKSLVMHGNGCTVFNENGDIVYRIDNYETKRSREVYLMDLQGKVLFTLRKPKFLGRCWEGYEGDGTDSNKEKPCFQVTRNGHVTLPYSNGEAAGCYRLEAMAAGSGKSSAFKITGRRGGGGVVVAEAKRKQSSSGVVLGDDVLTLMVEPQVDHSFIMALVTVHGLMHHTL